MPSKDMIGRVLTNGSATVTAEHIADFARALGDPDPLYLDAEVARRGPFGAIVAPPTYPIAFMTQAMAGGMDTFLELGLNFMTLVHGEQEFEYVRPLRIGETLTLTGRIADVYEKQSGSGGTLDFVVLETEGKDAAEKPVFYSRNILISKRT
ncbi:MAG TPA: MaoC family dehydratase N-terminal domain-containing protein [Candidatus Eisenbacteria bacterium]|nr:MaoC family dehydratase N-terminal domain-containing protein [Candidatus Eisenbacteria bacterium]